MRNDVAYVSFYMRSNTIRIFKSTIRAMGTPKFIRLRIHETEGTMIIEPYDRITFSSFRVPFPLNDSKEGMDIHSKRFIRMLRRSCGGIWSEHIGLPGNYMES